MPVDASIYKNYGNPFGQGFSQGISLAELIGQKRQERADLANKQVVQDAFAEAIVKDPETGDYRIDQNIALSKLAKGSPEIFMKYQDQIARQQIAQEQGKLNNALKIGQIQEFRSKGMLGEDKFKYDKIKDFNKLKADMAKSGYNLEQDDEGYIDIIPFNKQQLSILEAEKINKLRSDSRAKNLKQKAQFNKFDIPGLKYDGKTQPSSKDLSFAREAASQIPVLVSTLEQTKDLLKNSKREDWISPEFQKSVERSLRDAQLIYKSDAFANLGVLTGPDLDILEGVIMDPFSIKGVWLGPEGVAKQYDELLKNLKENTKLKLKPYGYMPEPSLYRNADSKKPINSGNSKPSWAK